MRTRAAPRAVLGHQRQSVQIHTPTGQLAIGFRSHEARHTVPGTRGVAGRPHAGKMMSDVRPASRGQPRSPSETSEGVGWAGRRQKWGSYAHRKQRWI